MSAKSSISWSYMFNFAFSNSARISSACAVLWPASVVSIVSSCVVVSAWLVRTSSSIISWSLFVFVPVELSSRVVVSSLVVVSLFVALSLFVVVSLFSAVIVFVPLSLTVVLSPIVSVCVSRVRICNALSFSALTRCSSVALFVLVSAVVVVLLFCSLRSSSPLFEDCPLFDACPFVSSSPLRCSSLVALSLVVDVKASVVSTSRLFVSEPLVMCYLSISSVLCSSYSFSGLY